MHSAQVSAGATRVLAELWVHAAGPEPRRPALPCPAPAPSSLSCLAVVQVPEVGAGLCESSRRFVHQGRVWPLSVCAASAISLAACLMVAARRWESSVMSEAALAIRSTSLLTCLRAVWTIAVSCSICRW